MKKFFRYLAVFLGIILILVIAALIAIQTPFVQTYIATRVIENINKQFGTAVSVGRVHIDFFGDVNLYDVRAKDHRNLEFISVQQLTADINLWDIYKNYNDITINSADLIQADIDVITYAGEEESNFIQFAHPRGP